MNARLFLAAVVFPSVALGYGESINGFPSWNERVVHEWMNRARCDPQVEVAQCKTTGCPEFACYTPIAPLLWDEKLNHAARFHADEMKQQGYFNHPSMCTIVSNINSIYPATCNGAASCACVGGQKMCSPTCDMPDERVALFGGTYQGEIISSYSDPDSAFYQWLLEGFNKTACQYEQGPPTNGHRWLMLKSTGGVGIGVATDSVGDFGYTSGTQKIPSGSHYPRSGASVDVWANWSDSAGPKQALVNVDGACTPMMRQRGMDKNGAWSAKLTNVATGCHRYFFTFKDSADNVVTYPTTGSLGIGPAGTCEDWNSTRPATGAGCACTPQCSGKTCGDDGCGGSCGNCAATETCQAAQCVGSSTDGGAGGTSGSGGIGGSGGTGGSADNPGGSGGADTVTPGCTFGAGPVPWSLLCLSLVAPLLFRRRRRA